MISIHRLAILIFPVEKAGVTEDRTSFHSWSFMIVIIFRTTFVVTVMFYQKNIVSSLFTLHVSKTAKKKD